MALLILLPLIPLHCVGPPVSHCDPHPCNHNINNTMCFGQVRQLFLELRQCNIRLSDHALQTIKECGIRIPPRRTRGGIRKQRITPTDSDSAACMQAKWPIETLVNNRSVHIKQTCSSLLLWPKQLGTNPSNLVVLPPAAVKCATPSHSKPSSQHMKFALINVRSAKQNDKTANKPAEIMI